ncbi:MAG: GNAT family N-acetyltransferase [Chloroflexota bacterium]|nr:GNAT family N-acetyltransferase [Chloroflexota bacterium]
MSFTEFLIQLCRPEDQERHVPRLAALIHQLAVEEGAEPAEPEDIGIIVGALLQSGSSDFLLATANDEPIGCLQIAYRLSTWQAGRYAYLEDFYLTEPARGRGVGTKLLDYALQRAESQGCESVVLDVRTANTAAQRLYTRFGFTHSHSTLMKRPLPLGDSYCDTTTTLAAIQELRGGSNATESSHAL